MFIVSNALLISSATVIVRAVGAIWLNPFATVLFTVYSAVLLECSVLYPCGMGVVGIFAIMQGTLSSVFEITERKNEEYRHVFSALFDAFFFDVDYVSQFPCGIMLMLRAVFNMLVRNASSRGHICFRCLMFRLSGPCELLVFIQYLAISDIQASAFIYDFGMDIFYIPSYPIFHSQLLSCMPNCQCIW